MNPFKWFLNKMEMWAYLRQIKREANADREKSLQNKYPLWLHRLHEHGAIDQRNLGVVVGDVTVYGLDKYRYIK